MTDGQTELTEAIADDEFDKCHPKLAEVVELSKRLGVLVAEMVMDAFHEDGKPATEPETDGTACATDGDEDPPARQEGTPDSADSQDAGRSGNEDFDRLELIGNQIAAHMIADRRDRWSIDYINYHLCQDYSIGDISDAIKQSPRLNYDAGFVSLVENNEVPQ